MKNRYGLSRHIPESIALEIRQKSKFGCVICRCAVYQYEHIDPEFTDATLHDPDKMCLLCGGCHDKVTRGRLSKETVWARYQEVKWSKEIQSPFEEFDLATNDICIVMGTAIFKNSRHLIRINGENLLSITSPKDGSKFPVLNGAFCDRDGQETLRIVDNVWEGTTEAWDITVEGRNVTVKTTIGRTALSLVIEPPNRIIVKELDMYLDSCHVICSDDGLLVGRAQGEHCAYIGIGKFRCVGSEAGIDVDSQCATFTPQGVRMVGGKGVFLDGTGIRIGAGAREMNIGNLKVWTR